jgi:multiple sugar transport system substrate-binding protein
MIARGPRDHGGRTEMGTVGRVRTTRIGRIGIAVTAAIVVCGSIAGGTVIGAGGDRVKIIWFVGLGAAESQVKDRTKDFNGVIKAFNKRERDIKLEATLENGDVHIALGDLIAGADVPDVIGPVPTRTFSAYGEAFADLAPLVDASGFDLSAYPEGLLDAYRTADGTLVGLPFGAYPSVVFYNRDLFDAAGLEYPPTAVGQTYAMPDGSEVDWDYDTLLEVAKLLTVDANGKDATSPDFDPERIVQFGFVDQFPDFRRSATLLGGPGTLIAPDGAGTPVVTIPDGWRDATRWLFDATWDAHVMPTVADINGELLANNPFGSGRVAMAAAPLWYTCCIADQQGTRLGSWDFAVLPVGLTGVTTSPLDADAIAIGGTSAYPEEAFKVLEYLLGDKRPAALWQVAPAESDKRDQWYRGQDQFYGGIPRQWDAADAMLGVPDVPSHRNDLPAHDAVQQRLAEFRHWLGTPEAASVDIDAELDVLTADLQAIVDGG